jgi:hypothetical protein
MADPIGILKGPNLGWVWMVYTKHCKRRDYPGSIIALEKRIGVALPVENFTEHDKASKEQSRPKEGCSER